MPILRLFSAGAGAALKVCNTTSAGDPRLLQDLIRQLGRAEAFVGGAMRPLLSRCRQRKTLVLPQTRRRKRIRW